MKRFLKAMRNLMFSFNVLASLLSAGVYAAAYVNPSHWWPMTFFPYLGLPLLLIHLAFVVWWAVGRRWQVLLSVITLVAGWQVNNSLLQISFRQDKSPGQLKIMTYNVGNFNENGTTTELQQNTRNQILEIIQKQAPDLLALQEYRSKNRGDGGFTDRLFREAGFEAGYFEKIMFTGNATHSGIAIFSRYPIISRGFIPFHVYQTVNACIWVDVVTPYDTVRLVNVHLQSNNLKGHEAPYFQGIPPTNDPEKRKGILKVFGKIRDSALQRAEQAHKVTALLDTTPHPVILCGDFNDLPGSYAHRSIRAEMLDTFAKKGMGTGNTYAGPFPSFRIDQIMADRFFEVGSHHVIKNRNSDHYPVVASLYPAKR